MRTIYGFAALGLIVLAFGVATNVALAQTAPTAEHQVALNPQPLPPFVDPDRDYSWGFDDEG